MHRAIAAAVGLVAGSLLAFFFVFRTLFADGPMEPLHPEYLVAHGLNIAAYATVVLLLVRFVAAPAPWWPAWVGTPGLLVTALYTDPGIALRGLTLLGVVLGLGLGWATGRAWRRAGDVWEP